MIIMKARKTLCNMAFKKVGQIKNSKLYNTVAMRFMAGKNGFGMNELLGIAAGIIIAAIVVVPGLRDFTNTIIISLTNWWGYIENILLSAGSQ